MKITIRSKRCYEDPSKAIVAVIETI